MVDRRSEQDKIGEVIAKLKAIRLPKAELVEAKAHETLTYLVFPSTGDKSKRIILPGRVSL